MDSSKTLAIHAWFWLAWAHTEEQLGDIEQVVRIYELATTAKAQVSYWKNEGNTLIL